MKKSVLEIEFDFDFRLWGIATTLRDYQVGLVLNRTLGTQLKRQNDIEVSSRDQSKLSYYSVFRYEDEIDKGIFHLIGNKYRGDFLIPEVKEADYFLKFCGSAPDEYLEEIQTKLKRIGQFIVLIPLNPAALKSRMNLVVE